MRLAFDPQRRLDCLPIEEVKLNLNCRDEIIPILRALQHVYADEPLRRQILGLVGKDVNRRVAASMGDPAWITGRSRCWRRCGWVATWIMTSCKTWPSSTAPCG